MKKIGFYAWIICAAFLNVNAGCEDDKKVDKAPEPEYTSLVGYWNAVVGFTYGKKTVDEDWKQLVQMKRGVFSYEFFSDGSLISHDNTHHFPSVKGNWKLEVKNVTDKQIEFGILSIYTDSTRAHPGTLFIEADSSMQFHITTETVDGKDYLQMSTKGYESYPCKFAYNKYFFERKN
nr:hypothetical protein [uncultured Dyadobacter sp.]